MPPALPQYLLAREFLGAALFALINLLGDGHQFRVRHGHTYRSARSHQAQDFRHGKIAVPPPGY